MNKKTILTLTIAALTLGIVQVKAMQQPSVRQGIKLGNITQNADGSFTVSKAKGQTDEHFQDSLKYVRVDGKPAAATQNNNQPTNSQGNPPPVNRATKPVTITEENGARLLAQAAQAGDGYEVKRILDTGIVNANTGYYTASPLYRAAERGSLGTVKILLAAGADVNAVNTDKSFSERGETPLFIAARRGSVEVVKELIKAGATFDHLELDQASSFSDPLKAEEMVNAMIAAGAIKNNAPAQEGQSNSKPMIKIYRR